MHAHCKSTKQDLPSFGLSHMVVSALSSTVERFLHFVTAAPLARWDKAKYLQRLCINWAWVLN